MFAGYPDGGYCGYLKNSQKWGTDNCGFGKTFICEKSGKKLFHLQL